MREAAFTRAARAAFARLSEKDQAEVADLVRRIEENPEVDNQLIFDLPRYPVILRVLDNGAWQTEFFVADEATIVIRVIVCILAL